MLGRLNLFLFSLFMVRNALIKLTVIKMTPSYGFNEKIRYNKRFYIETLMHNINSKRIAQNVVFCACNTSIVECVKIVFSGYWVTAEYYVVMELKETC